VTISLPLFDRNQGAIAAGEASRQQLFDEYVFRVAEARSSASQILEQLALVREQSASVAKCLPTLDAQASSAAKAEAGGVVDVVASYDARAALAIRQIEQIRLLQEAFELTVALEIATGRTSIP
jgi:outer membrane protein TolC